MQNTKQNNQVDQVQQITGFVSNIAENYQQNSSDIKDWEIASPPFQQQEKDDFMPMKYQGLKMDNYEDLFQSNFESSEDNIQNRTVLEKVRASSRVNFSKLTESEKNIRLKNMAQEIRKLRKQLRTTKTKAIKKQSNIKFPSLNQLVKVIEQVQNLKGNFDKTEDEFDSIKLEITPQLKIQQKQTEIQQHYTTQQSISKGVLNYETIQGISSFTLNKANNAVQGDKEDQELEKIVFDFKFYTDDYSQYQKNQYKQNQGKQENIEKNEFQKHNQISVEKNLKQIKKSKNDLDFIIQGEQQLHFNLQNLLMQQNKEPQQQQYYNSSLIDKNYS
ncbi:UNKNOWN [Stylonychia lemnae]|uniref:Uncharacterized protein n=1 Tax=Stylonychia lemnae TaxID=5949 RepID=A0A078AZ62_STYLE|nr:UNKNOWN [Stylonychia lemnae]|eukprot:CDW87429.1 UNKNOWN [Stylonychia lemnae]